MKTRWYKNLCLVHKCNIKWNRCIFHIDRNSISVVNSIFFLFLSWICQDSYLCFLFPVLFLSICAAMRYSSHVWHFGSYYFQFSSLEYKMSTQTIFRTFFYRKENLLSKLKISFVLAFYINIRNKYIFINLNLINKLKRI